MRTRPDVVAHRGASAVEAEHTLAAYRRALEDGADGVECDVRLTRDGVLVCVHDRRVDRTSSGRGVVSTLELADLSELDFGSWRRRMEAEEPDPLLTANWEAPDLDRTSVLTLERLLEMVELGRSAGTAGDRDQAPDPVRRSGRVDADRDPRPVRPGERRRQRQGPGAGDELRADRAASGQGARAGSADRAPDEADPASSPRRQHLAERDDRRSVARGGAGLSAVRRARARARPRGARLDRRSRRRTSTRWSTLGVDVLITNQPAAVLAQLGWDPPATPDRGSLAQAA